MEVQTLIRCTILALCQVPREKEEITFFLQFIQRSGAVVPRHLPFTDDVITTIDNTIDELRQQHLLDSGHLLVATAKGRDEFKSFRIPAREKFYIDLEKVSAFAGAATQVFEIYFNQTRT